MRGNGGMVAESEQEASLIGPGTEVDHFKVVRLVGRGGMGEVYLARDTKLGRKVALKIVHAKALGNARAVERFLFEARTTARFSHPHIVTVFAVGEHEGSPYVALEYLDGQNLRERMAEKHPTHREVARIGLAIAEALKEAHRHGILHRDLKPENVLVPADGRLRVVDFGLAKAVSVTPLRTEPKADTQVMVDQSTAQDVFDFKTRGGLMGTPLYMSPEQWDEEELTAAIDIWALGVVLYELLSGRHPYGNMSVAALCANVFGPDPVPALELAEAIPASLHELVEQCLAKQLEKRPSTDQVVEVLQQLVHHAPSRHAEEQGPFRGLLPFTEQHADLFFGRDGEVAQFLERLRSVPVIAVVGPSGAGKSSFIQAGVIPRLKEQDRWVVLKVRPGRRPIETLASRLLRGETTGSVGSAGARSRTSTKSGDAEERAREEAAELELRDQLIESPARLALHLQRLSEKHSAPVLLFVDQLEELYTLVEDETLRQRFMEAVCRGADDPESPVRVVLCMRDDFMGRLAEGEGVREALSQVSVLRSPGPEALDQILTRPLQGVGYSYDDPKLVAEMVAAVRGEPAALPLLQFVGEVLWERRDQESRKLLRSAYRDIGGVEGALARQADAVLEGLSPEQLPVARELFLRLVTPEGTRRVCEREGLLEGLDEGAEAILDRLVQERALVVRKGQSGAEVELVHESLIHRWQRLRRWIDESKEELSFLAEVDQAAQLWEKRGRRPAELWTADALREALRALARGSTQVPKLAEEFLAAARRRESARVWRRRGLLVGTIAVLAAIALVFAFQNRELARQKKAVDEQRVEALQEGARAALGHRSVLEARAKLRAALETNDSASARALWWRLRADALVWGKKLSAAVYDVAFSPDGSTIAVACLDQAVYLLSSVTRQTRVLRGHTDQIMAVAFSPDGRQLLTAGLEGRIRVWDVATGKQKRMLAGHEGGVRGLAVSPDGRWLATAGDDKTVRLWDLADSSEPRVLTGHAALVRGVSFSPDGKLLASASDDKSIRVWSVPSGKERRQLANPTGTVTVVTFSPDGKRLASGGHDRSVRLWEVASGTETRVLAGHTAAIWGLAFSRDGKSLASGSVDGSVRLWEVASGSQTRVLPRHAAAVRAVSFSPDGTKLATGSLDHSVRVWALAAHTEKPALIGHQGSVATVAFSPDGKRLASGGQDDRIRVWDVASGAEQLVLTDHSAGVRSVSFSPDGQRLASGSLDKTVRLWDATTGIEQRVLLGHTVEVFGVSFSPDGKSLASGSFDKSARLWDVASGSERSLLSGHTSAIWGLSYSPDGSQLATASMDRTVRLWDVASGTESMKLEGHTGVVWAVSYSPDGKTLASGSWDKTIRLWDVATGAETKVLGPHPARVYWLEFHPDGRRLAAPLADGTVRVWDLETGGHSTLRGHESDVNRVSFAPDGKRMATASDDGTVRLWDTDSGRSAWYAPLLWSQPPEGAMPLLLSHRGWTTIGAPADAKAAPELGTTRWRAAVEQRARHAVESPDGSLLCVQTHDAGLELWDLKSDELLMQEGAPPLQQVIAVSDGCVARTRPGAADEAQAFLYTRSKQKKQLQLKGAPTALGWGDEQILVAAEGEVFLYDATGAPTGRHPAAVGVTAIAQLGPKELVVGYRDGNVELLAIGATESTPTFSFDDVSSSPVTRIVTGPMRTLAVGYANGVVGLWSADDGQRFKHARLHGPVVHLVVRNHKLYAVSDFGQHLVWDLGVFYADRCVVLREIWSWVPVVWEGGRPVERKPPKDHPCGAWD